MYDRKQSGELYTLRKRVRFEAAHKLEHHDGQCARLHGHSWVAVIELRRPEVDADGPKRGMVADYASVNSVMKNVLADFLDHHYLNDTLNWPSPTSEYVARWLFYHLKPSMRWLHAVEIEETCTCSARYEETHDEEGPEAPRQLSSQRNFL